MKLFTNVRPMDDVHVDMGRNPVPTLVFIPNDLIHLCHGVGEDLARHAETKLLDLKSIAATNSLRMNR